MEDALVLRFAPSKGTTPPSLNPCCNGRCTRTRDFTPQELSSVVLILVVMEDALVLYFLLFLGTLPVSLNPCCNGRCTRTRYYVLAVLAVAAVLILVVMEDALVLRI